MGKITLSALKLYYKDLTGKDVEGKPNIFQLSEDMLKYINEF